MLKFNLILPLPPASFHNFRNMVPLLEIQFNTRISVSKSWLDQNIVRADLDRPTMLCFYFQLSGSRPGQAENGHLNAGNPLDCKGTWIEDAFRQQSDEYTPCICTYINIIYNIQSLSMSHIFGKRVVKDLDWAP